MENLLYQLFIIALIATVVTLACNKIKVPPIVGFLITGALLGPSAISLVNDKEVVDILAEIGVVFLLFTIGMEISIGELIRLRKPVFFGGAVQVGVTIVLFWLLAELVWHDTTGADLFVGFLIALSSTAIVLKVMQEKNMMESPPGRISLAILIFQDLIIVPMMLVIPLLAGKANAHPDMFTLFITIVKTVVLLAGVFILARKLIPFLLRFIVGTRSREVFLISIIGTCLGTAVLTQALGLSLSLGAFLAGLVVAESEYSHSALEGVLPFKEVFTSIFFISVGMLLDVRFFASHFGELIGITLVVVILKALIAGASTRLMGYPLRAAIVVGLALCQVGEFSFVLAKSGLDYNLLSPAHYQTFLAASILTMLATPFLISGAPALASRMVTARGGGAGTAGSQEEHETKEKLSGHIIILGFGVVGKFLARAAKMAGIPYIILEMNPDTVRQYAAKGEPIHYGDAVHRDVLLSLGVKTARVLAAVIPDPAAVRAVTEMARHANPGLYIVVRTRFLGEVASLKKLGASDVIPEEYETAVEIFTRVLSRYLVPKSEMEAFTREVRAENYEMLRSVEAPSETLRHLADHISDVAVTALNVEEGAPLAGKTLHEVDLRKKTGATVVAIRRDGEIITSPGGAFCFQCGDTAYLFAAPDAAESAESYFLAVQ